MSMRRFALHRETAGFIASFVFVCLASVRDVYFGALFQRVSPFDVAVVAFSLCMIVFLPGIVRRRGDLHVLVRRPRELLGVNATAAIAWLSFFVALKTIEPLLVQVLFAGIGPISVMWIDRLFGQSSAAHLSPGERVTHFALLGTLVVAAAVVLGGLSGLGPQPVATAALGVALATAAGIAISANTIMCRRLNDAGVSPESLVAVRFVAATIAAAVIGGTSSRGLFAQPWPDVVAVMIIASLALIVFPIYVNQVGVALASPVTVRSVLASDA